MEISLRQKILIIFLLLALLIIVAMSGVYYYLVIKDIRELSHEQITIAFDMMFDEFVARAQRTIPQINSFADKSLGLPLQLVYQKQDEFKTAEDIYTESWDEPHTQGWVYIQDYLTRLVDVLEETLNTTVPTLNIHEFVLYDRDRQVMGIYRYAPEQKIFGMYLPRLQGGTYVPLDTEEKIESVLAWQGIKKLSNVPIPDEIAVTYNNEVSKTPTVVMSRVGNTATMKFTTPIFLQDQLHAICVIHIPIPQSDADRYSQFSKTNVNIFAETTLSVGTLPEYETITFEETDSRYPLDLLNLQEMPSITFTGITLSAQEYYQGKVIYEDPDRGIGAITANFDRQIETKKGKELLTLIAGVTLVMGVIMVAAVFVLSARITRPITNITKLIIRITEGDFSGIGQRLMKTVSETSEKQYLLTEILPEKRYKRDEIKILTQSFYKMVAYLRDMAELAENISRGEISRTVSPRSEQDMLGHAFSHMTEYLHEMARIAASIAEGYLAVEFSLGSETDAFGQTMSRMTDSLQALIRQIRATAERIAETEKSLASLTENDMGIVQNVQASVAEMMSTMTEMGHSVEEVAHNMETLSTSVEETSSSVSEVTSSIAQIATSTNELEQYTQKTLDLINKAVQTLDQVTDKTTASKTLSQETMQDAVEGQKAVEQVRESMDVIQVTNQHTEQSVARFAKQSSDIGAILDVIHDITEQSGLLALNASIIAAQAGVHGRGFSVIAEEMRNLADEVEASTRNIAAIIRNVQQETNTVVQTIHDGTSKIAEGVVRTQQAQERLQKIITSAQRSSTVVTEIAEVLQEQMQTSHAIIQAMEQVHKMTAAITRGTHEEKNATAHIFEAVEHIADMAAQTKRATIEQLEGVTRIIEFAKVISQLTDQNLDSSRHINQTTTANLATQARSLLQEVDRFRLEA